MPSLAEVARAIYGAWRLMLFDADGMTFFDLSTGGFWRSFFAAVVVAPLYAVLVVIDLGAREEVFGPKADIEPPSKSITKQIGSRSSLNQG